MRVIAACSLLLRSGVLPALSAAEECLSQLQPLHRATLSSSLIGGVEVEDEDFEWRLLESRNQSRCNIFTLWEYGDKAPLPIMLVIEGWRRHAAGLCNEPVLIDDSNVKTWIPDMPDEYFKLPYQAAKSDMIRYGVLYHHGGIYMDTDLLVQKDLDPVLERMKTHEFVSYTSAWSDENKTCKSEFSSNFMGGPKGSSVLKAMWEKQKEAVTNHCPIEDVDKEKLCCFDEDHECHIPWARLGEGTTKQVTRDNPLNDLTYCFSDDESFVPNGWLTVFEKKMTLHEAKDHLQKQKSGRAQKPQEDSMNRMGYHMFNSNSGMSHLTCSELKDENSFVGHLQRLSFGTGRGQRAIAHDGSEQTKAWLALHPEFRALSDPALDGQLPC